MPITTSTPPDPAADLLDGWFTRPELAAALRVTRDTLSRWETRQVGPPCTRIGRKVFYRRAAVEEWILAQEQTRPKRQYRGRR